MITVSPQANAFVSATYGKIDQYCSTLVLSYRNLLLCIDSKQCAYVRGTQPTII